MKASTEYLRQWEHLGQEICCANRKQVVKDFLATNPSVWDWDLQLQQNCSLERTIRSQSALMTFGPIHVSTGMILILQFPELIAL